MNTTAKQLAVGFVLGGVSVAILAAVLSGSKKDEAKAAPSPSPSPTPSPGPTPQPQPDPLGPIFGRWGDLPPKFPVPIPYDLG